MTALFLDDLAALERLATAEIAAFAACMATLHDDPRDPSSREKDQALAVASDNWRRATGPRIILPLISQLRAAMEGGRVRCPDPKCQPDDCELCGGDQTLSAGLVAVLVERMRKAEEANK